MTDPEALIAAHKQVDNDWCVYVMNGITSKEKPLAEAGKELAALVDYTMAAEHEQSFKEEVRACVNEFWYRCIAELAGER